MLEQLKYLVELQILEDKKSRLVRSAETTPRKIAEIEKEFEVFEGDYLSKKADFDHAKKLHRTLEQSIADLENKIARSKSRMTDIKTNKEYHAVLKEIEDVKKEITAKEDGVLEVMERIDALSKEVKELEKDLAVRKAKVDEQRGELESESAQLKERMDYLEGLQQKVREKLEPFLLRRCVSLLEKQGGIAVSSVQNGVCQMCHLNIPPQKFIELQRDEVILQCPHCHRFLYWPGHEAYCVVAEELEEV